MVAKSLTGVVRPFETSDVQPPPVQTAPTSGTQIKTNTVEIGRGAAKTFTGTFDLTVSYYQIRRPKEKKKQQ